MESSESTPQFSLLVYLDKDIAVLPDFVRDLHGFFAKFPIPLEVVCMIERHASASGEALQAEQKKINPASNKIEFKLFHNDRKMGRAASMQKAFEHAQAPYICTVPIELSVPFGDVFKLLQNIIAEEKISVALGDRYKKKERSFAKINTPRARTENFFHGVLREKNPQGAQDPLCEAFAIKKEAWPVLKSQMGEVTGWYLAPALHRALISTKTAFIEVPVYDSGVHSASYVPWKQKLRLFSLSLKN